MSQRSLSPFPAFFFALLAGALLAVAGCGGDGAAKLPGVTDIDAVDSTGIAALLDDTTLAATQPRGQTLKRIKARDTLRAITGSNPVSYFIYRGQPMGYEYELLQKLAEHLGVALDLIVMRDRQKMFAKLTRGEADILAYRLTVTQRLAERVSFTDPLHATRQVLVQRLPPGHDSLRTGELPTHTGANADVVQYPFELVTQDDTVYVPENSEFTQRLDHLGEEMGGEIDVVEVGSDVPREKLIQRVARGDIDYTVANETVAELNRAYYGDDIALKPVLSVNQQIAWAVRDDRSWELLNVINAWLEDIKDAPTFQRIYDKYFKDRKGFAERQKDELISSETGRISEYDALVKDALEADSLGWDWRLVMAQMYQESKFQPKAQSWAGAKGLMQLMPPTARQYGAKQVFDPKANVRAAIHYLTFLDGYWKDEIPDPQERRRFILASYNAGQGHVEDARRLAEKYGDDKNAWDDVSKWLLRKAWKKYYQDDVVKYGYARGEEPVAYVRVITQRFARYRELVS